MSAWFAMVHWGMPAPESTLCGSGGERSTTICLVTCPYCQNIIDRHLHANPPPAATQKGGEGDGRG